MTEVTCIAGPDLPLWECPCRDCWALEMAVIDCYDDMEDQRVPWKMWREERA